MSGQGEGGIAQAVGSMLGPTNSQPSLTPPCLAKSDWLVVTPPPTQHDYPLTLIACTTLGWALGLVPPLPMDSAATLRLALMQRTITATSTTSSAPLLPLRGPLNTSLTP